MTATIDDAKAAVLSEATAKPGATDGNPMESSVTLFEDDTTEAGVWECTPGSWASSKVGINEVMYFIAGSGVITDADGTRHEFGPGFIHHYPNGWTGTWQVDETVRKFYVITKA